MKNLTHSDKIKEKGWVMGSVYKYYKERLIEISGKNRSLYAKNISRKYSYDIGAVIGNDKDEFQEFFRVNKFNLEGKVKPQFKSTDGMEAEEKRLENLRRERLRREEGKRIISSQVNALRGLKREIDEFAKETGRYELFVGYPFVTGVLNKDIVVKAPLILFPVVINVENDNTVSIEAKSDELVQFNKVLMLAYAKEHRLKNDGMIMEFDNLIDYKLRTVKDVVEYLANYGYKFDIRDNFDSLNKFVKFDDIPEPNDVDGLKIINSCVIGRFPLANSIYNDYTMLEKKHLTSSAIRQLLEAKNIKKNKKYDDRIFTINDLDYAQESFDHPADNWLLPSAYSNLIQRKHCRGYDALIPKHPSPAADHQETAGTVQIINSSSNSNDVPFLNRPGLHWHKPKGHTGHTTGLRSAKHFAHAV